VEVNAARESRLNFYLADGCRRKEQSMYDVSGK